MHGVDTLWSCWVVLFANSQYRSTHFLAWPSISQDHEEIPKFSEYGRFFSSHRGHSRFEHGSVIVHNIFAYFTLSLSGAQVIHDQGKMLVLPNQLLYWVLSTSDQCFVSFQPIWCHPHTQIRITLFWRCTKKHSQLKTFSQPCCNRIFSNCLSHNSPAKGWPYRFRSRGTTGSSILDHDFGQLCRGRRIQMSGHSDLGIVNNFRASSIFTWV